MNKSFLERAIINQCMTLVKKTNVCPETPRSEMNKIIEFSHDKGYLYTNKLANTFICGYKIPEISEKWKNTIPKEENGEIFFVNFAVSEEPNKWTLLRMLRSYLKENPEVKELCYFRRNSDKDFKRIILKRS